MSSCFYSKLIELVDKKSKTSFNYFRQWGKVLESLDIEVQESYIYVGKHSLTIFIGSF